MSELKPCPFCGGEVDNFHTNHKSRTFREHYFRCKKCEAYFSLPSKSDYRSVEETEREAKELWNRRAETEESNSNPADPEVFVPIRKLIEAPEGPPIVKPIPSSEDILPKTKRYENVNPHAPQNHWVKERLCIDVELLEEEMSIIDGKTPEYRERCKCETCLYNKNCQFLAKHRRVIVEGCTAYKNSADMVEVVRCKNCKENLTGDVQEGTIWCHRFHARRPLDGFCSYGEKKEGTYNGVGVAT